MDRRSVFAFAILLGLALPHSVWAQGQGQGQGNNNASSQSNGNGQENSNAGGNSNGNSAGNGNSNAGGNGNGSSASGSAGGGNNRQVQGSARSNGIAPPAEPSGGAELSESDALAAVEAGRAVSLSTILPDIRARTGGEVINAQLQQVQGFLLYAVKVLTPNGRVSVEYYYARSGRHVER